MDIRIFVIKLIKLKILRFFYNSYSSRIIHNNEHAKIFRKLDENPYHFLKLETLHLKIPFAELLIKQ